MEKKFIPMYPNLSNESSEFKPHPVLHPAQLTEGDKQAAAWTSKFPVLTFPTTWTGLTTQLLEEGAAEEAVH